MACQKWKTKWRRKKLNIWAQNTKNIMEFFLNIKNSIKIVAKLKKNNKKFWYQRSDERIEKLKPNLIL